MVGCSEEVPSDQLVERQDIMYKINTTTPFTGRSTDYYENGQLWSISNYKNGKCHGQQESYFENGQLYDIFACKNGDLHGFYEEYYINGQLEYRGYWEYQELLGRPERYDINGKDISNDSFVKYFHNGNIHSEGNYKDGREHGRVVFYHQNKQGQHHLIWNFKNGERHGFSDSFTEDGKLYSRRCFINGIEFNITLCTKK